MQYEVIEDGVKRRDIPSLREAIGGICYTSRDFSSGEFDEAIQYVESKGIKLKDNALTGDPTISSRKKERDFTDEDFAMAVFELKRNFCDERIADVKNIGKALYSLKDLSPNDKIKNGERPKAQHHQRRRGIKLQTLVVGLVIVLLMILGVYFLHSLR